MNLTALADIRIGDIGLGSMGLPLAIQLATRHRAIVLGVDPARTRSARPGP